MYAANQETKPKDLTIICFKWVVKNHQLVMQVDLKTSRMVV